MQPECLDVFTAFFVIFAGLQQSPAHGPGGVCTGESVAKQPGNSSHCCKGRTRQKLVLYIV